MNFKNPGNKFPYGKLYAIISRDEAGAEGICVLEIPGFGPRVAVTGDVTHLELLRKIAKRGASEIPKGMEVVVATFDRVETEPL